MKEVSPIIITGCPRSGASMIAGVVSLCGAFGGTMSVEGQNDRRGMFENTLLKRLEEDWLKTIHMDPTGQRKFPNPKTMDVPMDWKQRVLMYMQADGYDAGPWMYKSSRACLLWPIWHYAFPNAKWIIVRRRSGDIVNSCMKTAFMNAYSREEEWLEMVRAYEDRFISMIGEGVNCKQIWPQRMVEGNYQQLFETLDWVGLPWKNEVLSYIDPLFWKTRQKERS